jgi:hypothetical protein
MNGDGDWGLGFGDLGIGDWAQSPIPNPQSPIPNPQSPNCDLIIKKYKTLLKLKLTIYKKLINYLKIK